MKHISIYDNLCPNLDEDGIFKYFLKTLKPSITLWSYFVNWNKVFENAKEIEIELNILNYLLGKENFDEEFRFLLSKNPEVTRVIPALAVRNGDNATKFNILVDFKDNKLVYQDFNFSKKNPSNNDINKYLTFMENTGLKDLFTKDKIKNLVDYIIGVEAGLDSNARKNRGGTSMEIIVESFIRDFCNKRGYEYISQANAKTIENKWGYVVPVDKSSRRYDFVINIGNTLIIFETNFYGGGGSKLKSTAGEYKGLNKTLKDQYKFVWITDGLGWNSAHLPLRESFSELDHIFNLHMLESGALEEI